MTLYIRISRRKLNQWREKQNIINKKVHKAGRVTKFQKKRAQNARKNKELHVEKFDLEKCTTDQFIDFFSMHPASARQKLRDYLKVDGDEEVSEAFLDNLIQSIRENHNQDLLVLYVRWAKKVAIHFHSDTLSVVHCIRNMNKEKFAGCHDVMLRRNLTFYPRSRRRQGSIFHNTMAFTDYKKGSKKADNSEEEVIEEEPNVDMHKVAAKISYFRGVVVNTAFGKLGYRRSGPNAKASSQFRHLADRGYYFTKNLMEFHKPQSVLNRMATDTNLRHLAFMLCEILFKFKSAPVIWQKSCELTEDCKDKHAFLTTLAGVCLMFPTIAPMDGGKDNVMRQYWFDHIDELRSKASELARSQYMLLDGDDDITSTIRQLNRHSKFSFNGLHDGTATVIREQKFLLLRAAIFQKWMITTEKQEMKKLRVAVLDKLGYLNKRTSSSSVNGAKSRPVGNNPSAKHGNDDDDSESDDPHETTSTDKFKRRLQPTRKGPASVNLSDCEFLPSKGPRVSTFQPFQNSSCSTLFGPPPAPICIQDLVNSARWKQLVFKIPTIFELDSLCVSGLQLKKPDGSSIFLRLAPLEFYSADQLYRLRHLRFSGLKGERPKIATNIHHWIESSAQRFVDPDNFLFAIRPGDNAWTRRVKQLFLDTPELKKKLLGLVEAVACLGSPDGNRVDSEIVDGTNDIRHQQYRIDIQCVGQDFKGGQDVEGPAKVTGKKFMNTIRTEKRWKGRGIDEIVGDLCLLTWVLMSDLETALSGVPLAPNKKRNKAFAAFLREHLGIFEKMFNAESVTIVVGLLFPNRNGCCGHEDIMNDSIPGYTKTSVLNICLMSDDKSIVIHLQIILNFRKAVADHTMTLSDRVPICVKNINRYVQLVNNDYRIKLKGCTKRGPIPTAFDTSNFFLDDAHEYEEFALGPDRSMELLLPMIGPSRVLSYSMFIEPIHRMRDIMTYRQLLEVTFLGSLQCSPLYFNQAVRELEDMHRSNNSTFSFSAHPFYDIAEYMIATFGNWQCGLKARFQPCGGKPTIDELFGFGKYAANRILGGQSKLLKIIEILYNYTEWIDSLDDTVEDPIKDLPLSLVVENQERFLEQIRTEQKCQLGIFRLGLFTTIATGAGLLKPGKHLNQLAIPANGLASHDHLMIAGIKPEDVDTAMEMASHHIGILYRRLIMETLLCESVGRRVTLQGKLCDWFRRFGLLYNIDEAGYPMYREYGSDSTWKPVATVLSKESIDESIDHLSTMLLAQPLIEDIESIASADSSLLGMPLNDKSLIFIPYFSINDDEIFSGLCKLLELKDDFKEVSLSHCVTTGKTSVICKDRYYTSFKYDIPKQTLIAPLDVDRFCVFGEDILELDESFEPLFDYFRQIDGYDVGMVTLRVLPADKTARCFSPLCHPQNVQDCGVVLICLSEYFWVVVGVDRQIDDSEQFSDWYRHITNEDEKKTVRELVDQDCFQEHSSVYKCECGTAFLLDAGSIPFSVIVPRSYGKTTIAILSRILLTNRSV